VTRARRLALIALLVAAALLVVAYLRPVAVLREAGELWLRLSGVHSRYARAGAFELRYLEAGSGPPLVLVHGLGSNALQDWGRLVAPLARRYHVYAPDLPGFGRSERPKGADYSIPMQVEALRAFLAAVGVSRARVAGISMGGWIVARLAGEHPELVERLVVVASAGMRPDDSAPIPAEALLPCWETASGHAACRSSHPLRGPGRQPYPCQDGLNHPQAIRRQAGPGDSCRCGEFLPGPSGSSLR